MGFAFLVATLVAILAGSLAFLGQLLWRLRRGADRRSPIQQLLEARGSLTPGEAAEALGLSVVAADHALRSLVDDHQVRLTLDVAAGALRFHAVRAKVPRSRPAVPVEAPAGPERSTSPSRSHARWSNKPST